MKNKQLNKKSPNTDTTAKKHSYRPTLILAFIFVQILAFIAICITNLGFNLNTVAFDQTNSSTVSFTLVPNATGADDENYIKNQGKNFANAEKDVINNLNKYISQNHLICTVNYFNTGYLVTTDNSGKKQNKPKEKIWLPYIIIKLSPGYVPVHDYSKDKLYIPKQKDKYATNQFVKDLMQNKIVSNFNKKLLSLNDNNVLYKTVDNILFPRVQTKSWISTIYEFYLGFVLVFVALVIVIILWIRFAAAIPLLFFGLLLSTSIFLLPFCLYLAPSSINYIAAFAITVIYIFLILYFYIKMAPVLRKHKKLDYHDRLNYDDFSKTIKPLEKQMFKFLHFVFFAVFIYCIISFFIHLFFGIKQNNVLGLWYYNSFIIIPLITFFICYIFMRLAFFRLFIYFYVRIHNFSKKFANESLKMVDKPEEEIIKGVNDNLNLNVKDEEIMKEYNEKSTKF